MAILGLSPVPDLVQGHQNNARGTGDRSLLAVVELFFVSSRPILNQTCPLIMPKGRHMPSVYTQYSRISASCSFYFSIVFIILVRFM